MILKFVKIMIVFDNVVIFLCSIFFMFCWWFKIKLIVCLIFKNDIFVIWLESGMFNVIEVNIVNEIVNLIWCLVGILVGFVLFKVEMVL